MKFIHFESHANVGRVFVVHLQGTEANVRLMDDYNFHRYRSGQSHQYLGGHYRRSPVALPPVPETGHWNVVVDLGGYGGHVNASIS